MASYLVPLEATQSTAVVWIGVTDPPTDSLRLDVDDDASVPLGDGWTRWDAHAHPVAWIRRLTLSGMAPGTSRRVALMDGAQEHAALAVATLPDRLPTLVEPPLIALLGSCFAHAQDVGAVDAAFVHLPVAARPGLTFLCGDQVYLDAPFPRFLITRFGAEDLQAVLLQTYLESWGMLGTRPGLRSLLQAGPTFLASDDHEYWNNAPVRGALVRNSWKDKDRQQLLGLATDLFRSFQSTAPASAFRVGRLSVQVLDTRIARTADRERFIADDTLDVLRAWVTGLAGPGALVLGQLIFADRAGWLGALTDYGLPDFRQYAELVRILRSAQHDLVVMTGDVHFGRIAETRLPSGASLLEVVASPLALVDPRAGGTWKAPPATFPAFAIPGTTQEPVTTIPDYRIESNHFATLELQELGQRVRMTVRAWPIPADGRRPVSTAAFTRDLG